MNPHMLFHFLGRLRNEGSGYSGIRNPSPHRAGLSANAEKTAHPVGLKDP
jgi:hypothetical protein